MPTNYHEFEYAKFFLFKLKFMNTGRIHAERWWAVGSMALRLRWAREREYDCTQYQQNAYLTYGTREGKAALVYRKKFHNNSTNPRRPRSSPRLPLLAQGYEI